MGREEKNRRGREKKHKKKRKRRRKNTSLYSFLYRTYIETL